ncbi:cell surface protein [Listeria monocytogenes]|nr:cell surface protein [Listeria monocytogenes]
MSLEIIKVYKLTTKLSHFQLLISKKVEQLFQITLL